MLNVDASYVNSWLSAYRNNFILESNVLIYKLEDNDALTMLIDKAHISKYTYQSHNAWISKNYPTEEHTIEIRNWNSLATATKTFLSTKGNILYFKYYQKKDNSAVGRYSEKPRIAVIYDVKRDVKTNMRTIYCRSILSLFTSKASYVLNQRPSALLPTMANKQEYANAGIYYNPTSTINAITKTLDRIPANITDGELLQNIALATGHYIKTGISSSNNKARFELTKTTTSTYWNLPTLNIKENSYKEYKPTESTTIEILGSYAEINKTTFETTDPDTKTDICSAEKQMGSGSQTFGYINAKLPFDSKINSADVVLKNRAGTTLTPHSITISNDSVDVMISNPTGNAWYYLNIRGNKLMTEQAQTSGTTTISCMLLGGNISKDDYLSSKVANYYGYDTMVEFDCRIDPNFECGDVMGLETKLRFLDSDVYIIDSKVIIEELTITFNGAFNGHIKGRKAPTYE